MRRSNVDGITDQDLRDRYLVMGERQSPHRDSEAAKMQTMQASNFRLNRCIKRAGARISKKRGSIQETSSSMVIAPNKLTESLVSRRDNRATAIAAQISDVRAAAQRNPRVQRCQQISG
jgi:hypothetical protein